MNRTVEVDDCWVTGLSTLRPDPVRSARTRQRCRAALQPRARVANPAAPALHAERGRSQPTAGELAFHTALAAAVGILCVVYVMALIATTVSLQATTR